MSTLFEINKAIADFEFDIDEETGEVLNADGLDELELEREVKIENIGLFIKNLEAEAQAVKTEKDKMASRQKRLENKAKSLKEYLAYSLDGQKFSTGRVAISFRKSESVSIPDEAVIDEKYCNISMVRKPDKTAIKKALKEGADIHGASLVVKNNIRVE